MKKAWKSWLKVATIIGNIQMGIILFLLYWTIIPIIAIPFKMVSDPLNMKNSKGWIKKDSQLDMRKQY